MRTPTPWSWKRSLAQAVAFGALLALPCAAAAQAQPSGKPSQKEADRRARERFELGRTAFSQGQYRDAWEHFREAYILSDRPELLYNVGQSADRMRMDREALAAFRLYLQKLPNAPNRQEVENRILWLEENARRGPSGEVNPTTLDDSTDEELATQAGVSGAGQANGDDVVDGDQTADPETLPDGDGDDDADKDAEHDEAGMPADGQPERSAWYIRGALGLGVLADGLTDSQADSLGSGTLSLLLSIGYDINDGLVLGGGITFDGGLAPTVTVGETKTDIDTANLGTIMAFVDYYLAPRKHGWHLLGGLGIGSLALTDKSASVGVEDATGLSVMLAGGIEWPLSRDWALGGLLRIVLSRLSTDVAQHNALSPSLMFTAAWY